MPPRTSASTGVRWYSVFFAVNIGALAVTAVPDLMGPRFCPVFCVLFIVLNIKAIVSSFYTYGFIRLRQKRVKTTQRLMWQVATGMSADERLVNPATHEFMQEASSGTLGPYACVACAVGLVGLVIAWSILLAIHLSS